MRDLSECQSYVMHMHLEHRHIHEAVREVVSLFSTETRRNVSDFVADLVQKLASLRDELAKHFSEEDEGGCIEEAISRCPSLSHDASTLEGQHPALLAQLDELIEQAREHVKTGATTQLEAKVSEFAKNLSAHEALENRIMQSAFGTGIDESNSCS